jgi:hypothetical protein
MKVKYSGDSSRNAFLKTLDFNNPISDRFFPLKWRTWWKLENSEIKSTSRSAGASCSQTKQSVHLKKCLISTITRDRVFGGASRCVYEINDSGDSTTRFRTLNLQGSSFFNSEELSMATGSSFTRISGLLAVIHRFDTFCSV